jgi:hypothetical protein
MATEEHSGEPPTAPEWGKWVVIGIVVAGLIAITICTVLLIGACWLGVQLLFAWIALGPK